MIQVLKNGNNYIVIENQHEILLYSYEKLLVVWDKSHIMQEYFITKKQNWTQSNHIHYKNTIDIIKKVVVVQVFYVKSVGKKIVIVIVKMKAI